MPPTFFGGLHDMRVDTRWGLAFRLPWDHTQPNTVVDRGLITVLEAERRRPDLWRACSTRDQFSSNSPGVFPPQYRSSAILATTLAIRRSPTLYTLAIRMQFRNQACPWRFWCRRGHLGMRWRRRSTSWTRVLVGSGRRRWLNPWRSSISTAQFV